jgi:hypothetical protein
MTAHAVPVLEALAADDRPDYADAFEVRAAEGDDRSAEQWIRAGLEASAAIRTMIVVVHRAVLRFRLDLRPAPDRALGWRVVTSEQDLVRLEADGPLMRGVLVGRRTDPRTMCLTTSLVFHRPVARVVWTVVGPLHRRIAPYLLARAA